MLAAVTWVDLAAFLAALVGACGVGYWFGFRDGRIDQRVAKLERNGQGQGHGKI